MISNPGVEHAATRQAVAEQMELFDLPDNFREATDAEMAAYQATLTVDKLKTVEVFGIGSGRDQQNIERKRKQAAGGSRKRDVALGRKSDAEVPAHHLANDDVDQPGGMESVIDFTPHLILMPVLDEDAIEPADDVAPPEESEGTCHRARTRNQGSSHLLQTT
jgi:hypothetical protein